MNQNLRKSKLNNNHLWKKGKIKILDKTYEENSLERGKGIHTYLSNHPEISEWVVLDDQIFPDFRENDIYPHLVKTNRKIGLTDKNVEEAINILNGNLHF